MINGRWMAAAFVAALAGGLATAALAGDGGLGGQGRGQGGGRANARQMMRQKRMKMLRFLGSLQFTDQQRQVMLDKARAAAPIVEASRAEGRKIIAAAWAQAAKDGTNGGTTDRAALRAQVRSQMKDLRAKAWTQIEPLAKDVVATLTPDQRQKFADAAAKRGRTVDDAKLSKFAGFLISRPMAVPFLEARLGVSTPK